MCRYTKYLWIIKLSRTEVHFIFVFMSKLSYFPLHSMLKNSKNGVTFETTLSCPQSWCFYWLDVYIRLYLIQCCSVKQFYIQISHNKIESAILSNDEPQQKRHLANVDKNTVYWEAFKATYEIWTRFADQLWEIILLRKIWLDFENDTFPLTSMASLPKTVEKILQNYIYICLWS